MSKQSLFLIVIFLSFLIFLISSCDNNQSTGSNDSGDFSGITERNEWGDTLSVDPEDWVIVGNLVGDTVSSVLSDSIGPPYPLATSIGAYPNPMIPGAGHVKIEFSIPMACSVEVRITDKDEQYAYLLFDGILLPAGIHRITFDAGYNNSNLPNGIYRVFFTAKTSEDTVTSFGDVQVELSNQPDPSADADFVLYAQNHFEMSQVDEYDYSVATTIGREGGNSIFTGTFSEWSALVFWEKMDYLPQYYTYNLDNADPYQYHYLLAYKHRGFGAGWPDDGDLGIPDTTISYWQLENSYHDTYIVLYEQ